MYQVKYDSVAKAIESDSRCFRAILDFGDFQIKDDNVGTIKPSLGSVQSDSPCIGNVVSTQCEIQITAIPEGKSLEGKQFRLYFYLTDPMYGMTESQNTLADLREYTLAELNSKRTLADMSGFKLSDLSDYTIEQAGKRTLADIANLSVPKMRYEPIPIAKLTVLKCKKLSDYYTLTCSDRLHFADSKYVSNLTYPTTSDKVMAEIAQQIGCGSEVEPPQSYLVSSNGKRLFSSNGKRLITSTWQFDIMQEPMGYTKRQMIGFIAAMRGKFAVTDRTGTLVQRWYGEGDDLYFTPGDEGNDRHIDDYEMAETPVIVGYLSCVVNKDTTLTYGPPNLRKMEFECPYMTASRLELLYSQTHIDYYPCDLTQRLGDPRFDLWDRLFDGRKQLLMLNMDYTFDGGLMLNVTSGGDSDTEAQATGTY